MKKALIIIGILLIAIISYLCWYYTSSADKEIHLLSKGFTGIVIIRFNAENGKEEKYENGSRVYEIPASGILNTKFKPNEGWSDSPQYFYIVGDKKEPLTKKVYSPDIGVATSDITNKNVTFVSYIVSDEQHVDSLYTVREKMNIADLK
ncbi:hypothetical protein DNC80_00045 [Flavobacterium sp. SOK18b]|uniref:DUF6843 domain-containing protein n=1 Tax=Flavobacterium sp. SOK18b TaxID=797900 RepID=UPI0015FBAE25|nr:hypothetical protein [Flavobacterium sp. SOK18b]MBB1192063.1 hypothetical protein [Flavobacterium sp. SOK18b]